MERCVETPRLGRRTGPPQCSCSPGGGTAESLLSRRVHACWMEQGYPFCSWPAEVEKLDHEKGKWVLLGYQETLQFAFTVDIHAWLCANLCLGRLTERNLMKGHSAWHFPRTRTMSENGSSPSLARGQEATSTQESAFCFQGPICGGNAEITLCRIPLFMWPFWPLLVSLRDSPPF